MRPDQLEGRACVRIYFHLLWYEVVFQRVSYYEKVFLVTEGSHSGVGNYCDRLRLHGTAYS